MKTKTTSKYKHQLMMDIANNKAIFDLIDNAKAEYPDDLFGSKHIGCLPSIFSRIKIDFTPNEAGTYICLKVDYPSVSNNDTFKNALITIMVISHNGHIEHPKGGARTDLIAEELIAMLNFDKNHGFEIKLASDIEDPLNGEYYYRRLVFKVLAYNSIDNQLEVDD